MLNEPVRGVDERLPVTPRLGPGSTALQSQHHRALRKAWGRLGYVIVAELSTISMCPWGIPLDTTGYSHMVGAQRLKPRAALLPWPSQKCRACDRILLGPQPLAPRVHPAAPSPGKNPGPALATDLSWG